MIDLVFWSFTLPLATLVPLAVGAKSFAAFAAHSRCVGRLGASRTVSLGGAGDDRSSDFLAITRGFEPRPIENDSTYRDAVAILDRLFNLDRRQTPSERRYFQDLAERVYQYEHMRCVVACNPAAVETAGRLLFGVGLLLSLGGAALAA